MNAEQLIIEKKKRDYNWILENIASCRTSFQLKSCYNLIERFKDMYEKKGELVSNMEQKIVEQQNMLIVHY